MLLQRLKDYADTRLAMPPTLYSETPIRYIVELSLDDEGAVRAATLTDTADASNRETRRGQRRLAPQVARSVGIKPLLLADNAEYTFGLARAASRPDRVAACHAAYLDVLDRCADTTHAPEVEGVRAFRTTIRYPAWTCRRISTAAPRSASASDAVGMRSL